MDGRAHFARASAQGQRAPKQGRRHTSIFRLPRSKRRKMRRRAKLAKLPLGGNKLATIHDGFSQFGRPSTQRPPEIAPTTLITVFISERGVTKETTKRFPYRLLSHSRRSGGVRPPVALSTRSALDETETETSHEGHEHRCIDNEPVGMFAPRSSHVSAEIPSRMTKPIAQRL